MHLVPTVAGMEPQEQHESNPRAECTLDGAASQPAGQPAHPAPDEQPADGRAGPDPVQQAGQTAHGVHAAATMDGHGRTASTVV